MPAFLTDTQMWWALLEIVIVNILLSGDNAVVVALSCRDLPKAQRKAAIFAGTLIAAFLRIILTLFAGALLAQPYLRLAGGVTLVWIAIKFLVPDSEESGTARQTDKFWLALKTVVIADIVMSLDNVVGVAAAAKGRQGLLVVGLVMSIPLIIYGSAFIIRLLGRFPILITFGAAILGYIAGEMAISDRAVTSWVEGRHVLVHALVPIVTAAGVVAAGKILKRRTEPRVRVVEAGENPSEFKPSS